MNTHALEHWVVVASPLSHGAVGVWDELACLALPLFVAVTLWMLSRKPADEAEADAEENTEVTP
jgi:uncharacterized membrane protein YhdT